eukprot:CAMPEP_0202941638 /NCGR_PEP_ID=MMETSP1395-20130829/1768_1 /ASSEMBLY_ACC=CAM_ASM_000871 /TAXON_ID=5961 /ORGANISM="Blepharisma japonicum, Strain Stock R1072" /LENGTH=247 /DNA_ID=CAMNT_0049637035 /DNA_START=72 /DNA_END=815 /DNA_ORIENTATION=-
MLTWLGHASFKIECTEPTTHAKRILFIDPWLSGPTCPESERNQAHADVILVTHGHYDHCADAPKLSQQTGAIVVGTFELAKIMQTQGAAQIYGMNKGGVFENDFCIVHMVHADHSGSVPADQFPYAGDPVGYVVEFKDGTPSIYHGGDTNVNANMQITTDLYAPTIGLLPVGGRFTMGPRELAYALNKLLGSIKTVIPMHYGSFPLLTGTPEQLQIEIERVFPVDPSKRARIFIMNYGGQVELRTLA